MPTNVLDHDWIAFEWKFRDQVNKLLQEWVWWIFYQLILLVILLTEMCFWGVE